jgi:hypothetical protein
MIPSVMCGVDSDVPPGEKFLFRRLQTLPDRWVVMHSLVFSFERGTDAEADFLVISPSGDCVVIEVKSHSRIDFEAGLWRGNGREMRDPFRQARNAMYKLKRFIGERVPGLRHRKICRLVVFPFATFSGQSTEFREWEYLSRSEFATDSPDAAQRLERALVDVIERTAGERPASGHDGAIQPSDLEFLINLLRPTLRSSGRTDEIRLRESELARALQDQREALAALDENPRCLITGPAGSGKSLLAMRFFEDLVQNGKRPLLLCFNRAIADETRFRLGQRLPADRGFIQTVHAAMLRAAGSSAAQDWRAEEDWKELSAHAIDRLLEGSAPFGPITHLIVDEAQDLSVVPQCFDFFELLLQTTLESAAWAMFGDFGYQVLYEERDGSHDIRARIEACGSPARIPLRFNCRNTRHMLGPVQQRIADFATVYRGFRRESSSVDDCKVIVTGPGQGGFERSLVAALAHCRERHCRLGSTAVLFGDQPSETQTKVMSALGVVELSPNRITGESASRPVWTTIRKAKGLEFDGVVLARIPSEGAYSVNLLYTGCTRALNCVCLLFELGSSES